MSEEMEERECEDSNSENDEDETESDEHDEQVNEKITLKARKIKRSNGKWKLYYEKRVFKKEWLEIFPWVEEDPTDNKFAICRACNKRIKAHKGILETHQKTKRHLRQLSGTDAVDEAREDRTADAFKSQPCGNITTNIDPIIGNDDIGFFTESPVDVAHQAVTGLIDKLVEKYHESKLENLKMQNEAMLQLNIERAKLAQAENERKLARRMQQQEYEREAQETHLKFMQLQHETKISAMEDERDAKLRAVEQELLFARQEYEKKMKLLDVQLSCMK